MKRQWLAIGIIPLFLGTCIIPTISGNVKNQDLQNSAVTKAYASKDSDISYSFNKVFRYNINEPFNGILPWWNRWPDFPGRYEPFFKVHDIIDFGQAAWGLTSEDVNKDGKLDFVQYFLGLQVKI